MDAFRRFCRVPAGILLLYCSASSACAEDVLDRFQFHGFFSQGYALSDGNNYLTMQTGRGAFDFTDGGLSISMQITPKFRVGAQAYIRNIGELGNGRVLLDWASGDYRFNDYFGVRAGKVKTVVG